LYLPEKYSDGLPYEFDIVVAGVNNNSRYMGAIEWWFKYWLKIGSTAAKPILPILLSINMTDAQLPSIAWGRTAHIDMDESIPSAMAAQLIRLYWPSTLVNFSGRVITTDIDMLPLSTKIFDNFTNVDPRTLIVYRDILRESRQVPICYVSATTPVWGEVMGSESSFGQILQNLSSKLGGYSSIQGGNGWYTDQQILYSNISMWESRVGSVLSLQDIDTGHRRLDRSHGSVKAILAAPLAKLGFYSDYHIPLPAEKYHKRLQWQEKWLK
jgi:hypothetical protein